MDSVIFQNIYEQIQMFWKPLIWGSYLVGFILLVTGIFKLSESSQRGGDGKGIAVLLIILGLFGANFEWFMGVMGYSVFGSGYSGTTNLRANITSADAQIKNILMFVVASIKLLGFIGIWKGIFTMKKNANQGGSLAIGVTYVIGGTLAMNFELFAKTIANSVGGDVSKIMTQFF